jgi:uncharacterized protein YndB with AHSA1/START domain
LPSGLLLLVRFVKGFQYKPYQMNTIIKKIQLDLPRELVYDLFVNRLNNWWPKEYTWSQQKLVEIKIDPQPDGLCTEMGPFGFRCDWGRITTIDLNNFLSFKWQISPQRVPVPDPDQASDVYVHFRDTDSGTELQLKHLHMDRHGEGWEEYAEAMKSEKGWDYILNSFVRFASLQHV